ncbi:MAG TPA: hypothetical protein VKZ48_07035 [Burkholderiales bacterium]|nr:hypothetical protein [Burkholderiales bacterium]
MRLTSAQRWSVYAAGLAVAIGAAVWVDREGDDAAVMPSAFANASPLPPAAEAPPDDEQKHAALAIDGLPVRDYSGANGDPFSPRSWKEMAVQEAMRDAPPLPPPEPQPPPLPFSYMGKLIDGKETTVFLTRNDRNYVARVGETLDSVYRVEEIGEDDMVLVYLPLKHRQEMSFERDAMPVASVASRGRRAPIDDGDSPERADVEFASRPSFVDDAPRSQAGPDEDDE